MKYLIKVTTKCGYIIYTEFAGSLEQAEHNVINRMIDSGRGVLPVMEVKERYTASIEVQPRH